MTATTPRKKEWWERDAAPQFEYVPVDEPRGLPSAPKKEGDGTPERTWGELAKDRAIDVLGKGAVGVGEAAVGLADLATGGRAGKWMQDTLGYDPQRAREIMGEWQSEKAQQQRQNYAARMKEAKDLPLGERLATATFAAFENPDVIAQGIGESLGLMFAGGGAGGAVARGLAGRAGAQA
ncbi:MAG: hypothetical protein J6T92_02020, partial [Ottowia sp.]|nr:hypothetical protein [Ottowia sp.]